MGFRTCGWVFLCVLAFHSAVCAANNVCESQFVTLQCGDGVVSELPTGNFASITLDKTT